METPPPTPIPVIPLKPPSPIGWVLLLVLTVIGLGQSVLFAVRPPVIQESIDVTTVYRVNPRRLNQQIFVLIVPGVCALALALFAPSGTRFRKYGVAGMTLALLLPIVLWQHHSARIEVTPDTLTAPLRTRLLPGDPVTIRFDQMATLHFSGNQRGRAGRWQRCYTKDRREIEMDFGPLGDAAVDQIIRLAGAHQVRIVLPN